MQLRQWRLIRCVSKNVQSFTCYNVIHDPIEIIFGRNVTEKVRTQMMLFSHLTYLVLQHYFAKEETQKTAYWCFVHATQSNCCSALGFLSPVPCPQSPKLNALITRFRESYSSTSESWVKKIEEIKQRLVEFGHCTNNTASENAIFVFPVLPGSAETKVIWGSVVKRLLIAYFIGSISAKKYQHLFTFVKVIASQRWDVFWDTV